MLDSDGEGWTVRSVRFQLYYRDTKASKTVYRNGEQFNLVILF